MSSVAPSNLGPSAGSRAIRRLKRFTRSTNAAILGVLIVIFAVFAIVVPNGSFLSPFNLTSMASSAAGILILAVGSTFVIITGELDLSIASNLLLSGSVGILIMTNESVAALGVWSAILIGILATFAVGVSVGAVNGLLTTRLRVPSFIVTLGMLGVALGLAQLLTKGVTPPTVPEQFTDAIGRARILGVGVPVWIALIVTAIAWFLLAETRFGSHCKAVGSNQNAAMRAGVNVRGVKMAVFMLMGALCALAAILDAARFTTISLASHQTDNLVAIAAVIIGGTSLFGGRGSIAGTLVGTLIPIVLLSGLVISGLDPFWQNIAIGVILVAAVAIDIAQRDRLAGTDSEDYEEAMLEREVSV